MNDDIERSIGNDVTMKSASAAALGRIDHYELLKEPGGGGFGTVYLARNTVAGIDVAVKRPSQVRGSNAGGGRKRRRHFLHHLPMPQFVSQPDGPLRQVKRPCDEEGV